MRRPLPGADAGSPEMVALLFTDLVGSTEVLDRLGDAGAERIRKAHFELLREAVRARRGQEVKTLGDGLMVVFGSAVEAVACAVAVQEAARRHNEETPDELLMIRVGLHVGEPVRDEDDYFGTAVVVARRLCDLAVGGQILASDLMRGLVGPRREHDFRPLGALALKGLQEPVSAYEVSWDGRAPEAGAPARPRSADSVAAGVLRTRLLPPRLPPGCVDRPELVAALRQGLEGRLVAVVAGAGYGKTTLLAQALHSTDRIWIWCSCDARIGDPGALLAHVAEGIRERFPGFGSRLLAGGSADEAVADLCNEVVETVSDDFVLVLDDVHLLPPAALDCLGPLVGHLPPNAHLALAGRAPLPFSLARLRALRVVEIGEDRLAFDLGETAELVRSLGVEPDDDTVAGLHHRTEGWAAGLILAAQSGDTSSADLSAAQFDYLAEEILARQPPEVQEFLLDTSMLGRFSPELAAAVSGRADAADIARRLVRQHLFAVRLATEGEWYRYHHLLQAFLQGRLRERDPERLSEGHRRAAAWWAAEGQPAEVVRHLLEAGEQEAAVDAIEPVAERMVLTSEGETLAGWLDAIPRPLWQDRPPIVLAQVGLLLHRARHEAAFAEAEEAIERLIEAGDHARAATAIVRLQQTMITAGTSPRRRWESGERHRDRIAPHAPMLPVVRILLATAYGYGCRFAEARDELTAALALPAAERSEIHRGYAAAAGAFYVDYWTGRPLDALRSLEAAISELEAIDPEDRLRFRLFARMLNAYLMLELGRFEETLAFSEALREDFRRLGVEGLVLRSHNWIVWTALAGLGRWDELGARFEAPRQDLAEETCYAYRYLSPGALLAAAQGSAVEVAARVETARREMRGFGVTFDESWFLCDFSMAAHAVGLTALAHQQARDALEASAALGSPLASARAALVAAHVGEGDAGGDDHLARALALTDEHGFTDLWSGRERFAAPGLLARALAGGIGPPGVADRVLAGCGGQALAEVLRRIEDAEPAVRARAADLLGNAPDADIETVDRLLRDRDPSVREAARRSWMRLKARPRAAISIISLGEFRVLRDGVTIPSAVFVRQKARALLACLVASGGPVHRETLCEWLWPELAPDRAAASLRSTLYDLRRAVEPELEAGSPLSLIGTEGEMIRLALSERDRCDAVDLAELATAPAGDEQIERLTLAETLYRGTFLADWPFEDWAAPRRAELEELFKGVVERLAAALVDAGRPREGIPRYRRLLLLEPEREGWHRDLMRAYAAAGERALALRQFHACRTLLRREQGVEPDAETRALYGALLREEDAAEVL